MRPTLSVGDTLRLADRAWKVLAVFDAPHYQEHAAEMIRRAGSLYIFGLPMLRVLLSRPEYWPFLNWLFLRKNLWHVAKLLLKRVTPTPLGNWYLRRTMNQTHHDPTEAYTEP